jgi:tight adherence protein C
MFEELDLAALLPCIAAGAAAFTVIWWVAAALAADELRQGDEWRYDVNRINGLRKADVIYRMFPFAIDFLARLNQAALRDRLPEVRREILVAGHSRYWLPEEFLARNQVIVLLLAPFFAVTCVMALGPPGAVSALLLAGMTLWLLRRRLTRQARERLQAIKRRLPFLLDLLTLLMHAGSSFLSALQQAVDEFAGHPVSEEFGRVLADIKMGKTRTEAFNHLRGRLDDQDVSGIIGAIVQGEELGSPLAEIFRSQADVLRVKRSQRAETIAAEAGVNMLLPGVLVMAATVLIILGPFALNYLLFGWGF